MRDEEQRSEEDGQPSPAQPFVVVHADAPFVHARILGGGYGVGVSRTFLLALVPVLAFAGCGGDGKRLSRAEYASKADAICQKGRDQTNRLQRPANLPDLADVADQTLPILDGALHDLRELEPPADEQGTVDRWLAEVEKLKDDVEEIRDKAKANDRVGVGAVAVKARDHNARANELATVLGMHVCNTD
jgi:hypothetical protein